MDKYWNEVFWDTFFSTFGKLFRLAQKTRYDSIRLTPLWKIERFKEKGDSRPYDVSVFHGNVALNEGINLVTSLICGGAGTSFGNATAQTGIGDDNTPALASQTGLIGSATWVGMDAGYPIYGTSQIMTFKSTFSELIGNQSWQEFSIRNSSVANINLNRKVQNEGTKSSGQIWIITTTFTLS